MFFNVFYNASLLSRIITRADTSAGMSILHVYGYYSVIG